MSEEATLDFAGGDRDEVAGRAAALMRLGRGEEVAAAIFHDLLGPSSWRRSEALERLFLVEGIEKLLPHFSAALADDEHADRRNAARSVLSWLASPSSPACEMGIAELTKLVLEDPRSDVRLLAAAAIGEAGNTRGRAALEQALSDPDPNVSSASAEALGLIGDCRALPALLDSALEAEFWVRAAAIVALGKLRDQRGLSVLGGLVGDPFLGSAAATAIGEIGSPKGLELLKPAFADRSERRNAARDAVARIYAKHPGAEAPAWLREALAEDVDELLPRLGTEEDVRAARLLGIAGSERAVEALFSLLSDADNQPIVAVGLENLPTETKRRSILERLPHSATECRSVLLDNLPPLSDEGAIRGVVRHLADGSANVRAAAAKALGSSDPELVRQALEDAAKEPGMRLGVALAYGYHGPGACESLLQLLQDPDARVRATAAASLGRCATVDTSVLVAAFRSETDLRAREAMLGALGASGGAGAVELLSEVLGDANPAVRFAAARGLGRTGSGQALEPLLKALEDSVSEVRVAALIALGDLGDPRASSAVGAHLTEGAIDVRRTAIHSLDLLARPGGSEILAAALNDADAQVRLTAVDTLRRIGDPAALPLLTEHADSEADAETREATTRAIVELRHAEQTGSGG